MRYLILLNRKFPYKSGEAFLENEIDEISKGFDKVLIYPSDVTPNDKKTRSIKADNTIVRLFQVRNTKIGYIVKAPLKANNSENKFIHPIKRTIDGYFNAAVDEQAKLILKDLSTIEFGNDDEVYLYSYWLYITAGVACVLKEYFDKRNIKVKAFSRAHRFDIYEENRKFGYLPRRKALMEKLDAVFPCSDDGTAYLKNKYPKYSDKIITSYLGTYDHGGCSNSSDGVFRIVSCSRLSSVKRVDMIIDALDLLKGENTIIEWTHIGGGELLEKVRAYSKKLDWMNVTFTGPVSNKDVYKYYSENCVDVFVNVSSSEGLPVSIMEAISYGIPTIATDVGGTKEIVLENVSGFLLNKSFHPQDLANKITEMLRQDADARLKLRRSTRDYWIEHFQAPINYKEFLRMIIGEYK